MSSSKEDDSSARASRWLRKQRAWENELSIHGRMSETSLQPEWKALRTEFEREEIARVWGPSFKDLREHGRLDDEGELLTDDEDLLAGPSFPFVRFLEGKVKNLCLTSKDPRIARWTTGFDQFSKLRTEMTRVRQGGRFNKKYLAFRLGHDLSEHEFGAIKEAWRRGGASSSSRGSERSFLLFKLAGSTDAELRVLQALCEDVVNVCKQRGSACEQRDDWKFSAEHELLYKVSVEPGIDFESQEASDIAADITQYLSRDEHELAPGVVIKPKGEQLLYITGSQSETTGLSQLNAGSPLLSELHGESAIIHEMQGADSAHASELMGSLPTIHRSTEAAQEQATRYAAIPHPGLPELQAEREPAELEAEKVVRGELEGPVFVGEDLYSGPDESAHDASKKPSRSRLKDVLKRAVRKGFGSWLDADTGPAVRTPSEF